MGGGPLFQILDLLNGAEADALDRDFGFGLARFARPNAHVGCRNQMAAILNGQPDSFQPLERSMYPKSLPDLS